MIPRATYRVQLHKGFGFDDVAKIAPYLKRLGVSHVYCSPWLKARTGSQHGYDIVDHGMFNPELGDAAAFDRMMSALRENGLGQILDFVPNHMGVGGSDNPLWLDVLEWGPDSVHAAWFDIDWKPQGRYLRGKLLAPFLGNQYGIELYDGKLLLKFEQETGSFAVWAYDTHKLPICPLDYARILGDAHPKLERLGDAFTNALEWRPQIPQRVAELKAELARTAAESDDVRRALDHSLKRFNGQPGVPESWRHLNALIQAQHWRAAYFRVAADDINYRRFFNINGLAGMRMEVPAVFDHAHRLVFDLLERGALNGLRIDHIDGLFNPKQYLQRLREGVSRPFYLVVEKILAHHESLREDWPVEGTTGYEFANLVLGLLIDPAGEEGFTRAYEEFTGERRAFPPLVRECKIKIMRNEMSSELNVLARDATRLAHQNPRTADFTHNILRRALRETVACFPVYRTYVTHEDPPTESDRRDIEWALKQARANETTVDASVFDFIEGVLSGSLVAEPRSGFSRHAVLRCAMKLQQYSGPVMAKGLEDTAFYRYNRFIALNEVGGHPDRFGVTRAAFHKANVQRAKRWPHTMLSTSTHDTKRGEDTRARLAVLSEMPNEWSQQVHSWSRILRARRGDVEGTAPPDRNDEYLFYQLLVGTWPAEPEPDYTDRLKATMIKSVREARLHSNWDSPNVGYENALAEFVEQTLDVERSRAFLAAFLPFQERVARLGMHNSLVQTVLKLTAPGVPDIYQGAELTDLSMVDPDNRRPVDYLACIRALEHGGMSKIGIIAKILGFRREHGELFAEGDYEAVGTEGCKNEHVCAFLRRRGAESLLVAVARFPAGLESDPGWCGTVMQSPPGTWHEVLSNTHLEVDSNGLTAERAFSHLPVALFYTTG